MLHFEVRKVGYKSKISETNNSWLRILNDATFSYNFSVVKSKNALYNQMIQHQQLILDNYPENYYEKVSKNAIHSKRILILSDSLGLPRPTIPSQATYPFLVSQYLINNYVKLHPLLISKCIAHRTLEDVVDEFENNKDIVDYDLIVVHVGLVDCTPRVFLPEERLLLLGLQKTEFGQLALSFANQNRSFIIKKFPDRVYVPLEKWKNLLKSLNEHKKNAQNLIFINIVQPSEKEEQKTPGSRENVTKYNSVLKEFTTQDSSIYLIDLNSLIIENGGPSKLTVDEQHINQQGHKILAKALIEKIDEVIRAC